MRTVLLGSGLFLLAACANPGSSSDYIKVYKHDGSVQCGYTGIELDAMGLELKNAGIDVACSQKGHDGLMRAAVCGMNTGTLNIYTIAHKHLPEAVAIGFRSVTELAEYQDQECKK